jgi:predicted GH43/DUF377 family glycosyl hydrolase
MNIRRIEKTIMPSQERVLIRPFIPNDPNRTQHILSRISSLSEKKVRQLITQLMNDFSKRHLNTESVLFENFNRVKEHIVLDAELSRERKLLIGAYFTQEYSLESAALFNPSMVPHPDQSEMKKDELRFIMSLRATGEGHISSIVFREGMITAKHEIRLRRPTPFVTEPEKIPNPSFEKALFIRKLDELDVWNNVSRDIMARLADHFRLDELLLTMIIYEREHAHLHNISGTLESIKTLAYSNYEVTFNNEQRTSEKVIFPSSPSQRNGIEDARFVYFTDDDGAGSYISTYTAYDGRVIIPQLLETNDFNHFRFVTLNGPAVRNKGMALFPRKINGYYTMLSRQDNENIYIMYSNNLHFWYDPVKIMRPAFPWEYVQLGNCGSPLEVDDGWLVLSHGVGPMRKYCIGAFLLDKEDPSKLVARLQEPLLQPEENERKGYVPNVVYTCGALIHRGVLILPYAMSDYATTFALIEIDELIGAME